MLNDWIRALATVGCAALLVVGTQASAAPIGAAAPIDGYGANSGIERFDADDTVFAVELMDSPGVPSASSASTTTATRASRCSGQTTWARVRPRWWTWLAVP